MRPRKAAFANWRRYCTASPPTCTISVWRHCVKNGVQNSPGFSRRHGLNSLSGEVTHRTTGYGQAEVERSDFEAAKLLAESAASIEPIEPAGLPRKILKPASDDDNPTGALGPRKPVPIPRGCEVDFRETSVCALWRPLIDVAGKEVEIGSGLPNRPTSDRCATGSRWR